MVSNSESQILRKKAKKLTIFGGILIGGGALVIIMFPIIVKTILNHELVIKEGNELTEGWKKVPIPVTTSVYIWSVENPKEFERGAKPLLRELGPFVYSTNIRKEIISWGPNQESIKYWTYFTFHRDQLRTVGDFNQRITVLNVPAYTAVGVVRNVVSKLPLSFAIAPVVFAFVNTFFSSHGEGLYTRTTPKKLIEGRHIGMVRTINLILKPFKWLGIELPGTDQLKSRLPGNKFGLLHMMNNSRVGPYEIWTGQTDPKKFDHFVSFQGKKSLNFYRDRKCNQINGTEGITFGSFLKKKDVLYVFNGDVCRSLYATYKGLSHVRGIPTWRYGMPAALFASPDKNPDNKCFCTTPHNYKKCDGILDIGPCQMGAPLAFSFPHLLYTSKLIQSGVRGISPDPNKHEAYFDINPILGIPVNGKVRLQINLLVKPVSLLPGFRRLPETVLPFVWLEIGAGVSGTYEWMMRFGTYALLVGDWGPYFAILGGFGVLGFASYLALFKERRIFKPKSIWTPLEPFEGLDKQTDDKTKFIYQNLFSLNGKEFPINLNSKFHNNQHQNIESGKHESTLRKSPINGISSHPSLKRTSLLPPGLID